MRRPAFTLIELAICLSIIGVMVPVIFTTWRQVEDAQAASTSRVTIARAARTLSEELRHDSHQRTFVDDAAGVTLSRAGECGVVRYQLKDRVVLRDDGCSVRALARGVQKLERKGDLVTVTFDVAGDPRPTELAIGLMPSGSTP
ncbi:MAG: type II secretion system protein [Deltaproteobacteria bacterium]|nr:type II secretion system protein [Deltaproteobacteria bacterium]